MGSRHFRRRIRATSRALLFKTEDRAHFEYRESSCFASVLLMRMLKFHGVLAFDAQNLRDAMHLMTRW
eukprot:10301756-Lingulodinium_polyedra.AAC.1